MKHFLSVIILGVFAFLFWGSAAQKHVAAAPKQTFTFDYKTKSPVAPGSANITLSLVRIRFADRISRFNSADIFTAFQRDFEKDLEELLVDKGFRIRGPYSLYDEMVFEDKKESDVGIEVEIEPRFTAAEGGWKAYQPFQLSSTRQTLYYYEGTVSLTGKINLTGYEPLSHERIWVKSVEMPSITNINVSTAIRDFTQPVNGDDPLFLNDANVYNALGNALQQQYQGILAKVDAYFDPREFTSLRPQIKELKSKKGY